MGKVRPLRGIIGKMADFYQNNVPTFTILRPDAVAEMEARLIRASRRLSAGVIIPALFSDLVSPAMRHIIEVLADIPYIHRVYISLDRANRQEFLEAMDVVAPLGEKAVLLWNDNPAVRAIIADIERSLPVGPRGKGQAVWTALGYVLAKGEVDVLAFHDADILTYDRAFLARLLFPVMVLRYQFAKGFYARYKERLFGRVVRLFYFPFVHSLQEIFGNLEFLEYMADFRYPLSGEFATFVDIAREIRFPSDWGIEVGILAEVYRLLPPHRVCQVELTHRYDHKHQQVGTDARTGLLKMVADIARTFFTQLAAQGLVLNEEFFHTLKLTYLTQARELVGVYESLARMNGLTYDLHSEMSAVESFAEALTYAFEDFHRYPFGSPMIPSWRRVDVALGGILDELREALEEPLQDLV